jgi:hypothetical protein
MNELNEEKAVLLRKIALQREALSSQIVNLQRPLQGVQKSFTVVRSLPFYWKIALLAIRVVKGLFALRRFFTKRSDPISNSPRLWRHSISRWVSRLWNAYGWYVTIRRWIA